MNQRTLISGYRIGEIYFAIEIGLALRRTIRMRVEDLLKKIFKGFAIGGSGLHAMPSDESYEDTSPSYCTLTNGIIYVKRGRRLVVFQLELESFQSSTENLIKEIEHSIFGYLRRELRLKLCIHGACLKKFDTLLFIVAPSGAGKTTLSLGLLSLGYKMLTDDLTILCDTSGRIVPYLSCPKIRHPAQSLLREIGFDLGRETEIIGRHVVLPEDYTQRKPQRLTDHRIRFVFLSRSCHTEFLELDSSSMFVEIVKNSNWLYRDPRLELMDRFFANARAYRLGIDELGTNLQQIVEMTE